MIEIKDLTIKIGKRAILKNISFSLIEGTMGVFGLNGIGKTTLLKTIAGIIKSYEGQIIIDQLPINTFSRKELAKIVSFVPQEHTPYFNFTVEEMVMFGRTPYLRPLGMHTKNDFNIVEEIILEMGIKDLQKRYYSELSGGEKRLVMIAMSLAQGSQILLFDEPTNFLDLKNAMLVINKIKQLATEMNKIVIVTMHDINQVTSFLDSALLIYSEDSYEYGNTKQTITGNNLKKLYGMNFTIIQNDNVNFFFPANCSK